MMRAQLDDIRDRGEPLAALWASEETIYGRFGYGLSSQDARVRVSRVHAELQPGLPQVGRDCAARRPRGGACGLPAHLRPRPPPTPGFLSRSRDWWALRKLDDRPKGGAAAGELNRLLLELDGRPAGYALYRIKFEFERCHER